MKYVCQLPVIPLRSEPSERAEMVSQLLFGESFDVLDVQTSWVYIRTHSDAYLGWVSHKQITSIQDAVWLDHQMDEFTRVSEVSVDCVCTTNPAWMLRLPCGSLLRGRLSNTTFPVFLPSLSTDSPSVYFDHPSVGSCVSQEQLAMSFLCSPYLWGGRTYMGLDCSGFTQLLYQHIDLTLPRDAADQARMGKKVERHSDARKGDLLFCTNEQGRVVHVAYIIDSARVIHASGYVRLDRWDERGIYSIAQGEYSHNFAFVRRLLLIPT